VTLIILNRFAKGICDFVKNRMPRENISSTKKEKRGARAMIKRIKDKRLDPARYSMVLCPACGGKGKFLDENKKVLICSICGGFGLIKKENNVFHQDPS